MNGLSQVGRDLCKRYVGTHLADPVPVDSSAQPPCLRGGLGGGP